MTAATRQPAAGGTVLAGWGRTTAGRADLVAPQSLASLHDLIVSRPAAGLLARGSGLSYGDAAVNTGGLVLPPGNGSPWPGGPPDRVELDTKAGTVRACAAVTFAELLEHTVPEGWLLPVLPGTRHLTLGGAIAADVHGKNQRGDGSIAAWLDRIELMDGRGTLTHLTPEGDPAAFAATVGGMGLTGVILAATLRLLPIRSARMQVTAVRAADLDALTAALDETTSRYAVAWIDGTARGRALGRGVVDSADHLETPDPVREPEGPRYTPGRVVPAPALPFNPVNRLTARAFNSLWYRAAPRRRETTASAAAFFHRLDTVSGWNRTLGPAGIWQYQFVVPDASRDLVAVVLETLQRHHAAPFLGTLKRFGPGDGHPLSFPTAGWSLAVDMPAARPRIAGLLSRLDRLVATAGGRIYLAKDARMDRSCFTDMYGPLDDWRAARARLDPDEVFRSDLGRRLGLSR